MNKIYIYAYILIIVLFLLSVNIIKGDTEGFEIPWYANHYFVMPILITIFVVAPLLYLIYSIILRRINDSLTSVNNSGKYA